MEISSIRCGENDERTIIHVFWEEGMLKHETGRGVFDTGIDPGFLDVLENHPENSDRVKNMVSILERGPIAPFISWHQGRTALLSELLSFHTRGQLSFLFFCSFQMNHTCRNWKWELILYEEIDQFLNANLTELLFLSSSYCTRTEKMEENLNNRTALSGKQMTILLNFLVSFLM